MRILLTLSAIVNIMCHYHVLSYNVFSTACNKVLDIMEIGDQPGVQVKAKPFAEAVPSAAETLRARKQQVVRDALSEAAAKLFGARGFEAVTVEEIAQAAGVSRRTFFRYYEFEEDVVVERFERHSEQLLAELTARPPSVLLLLAICNALIPALICNLKDPEMIRDVVRLLRETGCFAAP